MWHFKGWSIYGLLLFLYERFFRINFIWSKLSLSVAYPLPIVLIRFDPFMLVLWAPSAHLVNKSDVIADCPVLGS